MRDGWNADLSFDERRLVFERAGQILIAAADGTRASPLPRHPSRLIEHYGDSWPTFSPDGEFIAAFLGEQGRHGDYWILPSDGGQPRRVTSDLQEGGAPAWTPDGKALVVSSSRSGGVNLWRVPVAGGPAEALTTGSGEDLDPGVSPDGRTLFFANVKRTWALVVQDVHSNTQRIVLEQRRPLAFPRYSPDGRRIALMGRSSRGEMQLWVTPADRPDMTTVTDGRGELNIMPQWSGDGKMLYYYQVRPAVTFRSVALSGGASSEVAPWAFARHFQAAVDPGGRTVAYSLVQNRDLLQSRVLDLETRTDTALPFSLYEQRFSRDGRLIAGESRDHELVVCPSEGGRCRTLTAKNERPLTMIAWSGDSTRIFFLRHTASRVWGELTSVAVDGGAVTEHGKVGPFERDFQMSMDMSPRDEIVFPICRESPHELWLARLSGRLK